MRSIPANRTAILALSLQSLVLLAILAPFLRFNNLLNWDFPGHYAAIWHLKAHLFPWATGWNPFFYCGYPQGIFYPPLGHYLTALLSFLLGIGPSMKVLLTLAVLGLPTAFYLFSRRWGLETYQALVSSLWMTSIMCVRGESLGAWNFGSDLASILTVGLYSNTLSLPVLFLFFATFDSSTGAKVRWRLPSLLLGILLLLHPYSAILAGLFAGGMLLERVWQRVEGRTLVWKPWILGTVSAMLIGAPWWLPFVRYRWLMNAETVPTQWTPPIILILLNGAALAVTCIGRERIRPLAVSFLILVNFILIGTMWKWNIEFTRLTIYPLLMLPALVLCRIRTSTALATLALTAVLAGTVAWRAGGAQTQGVADFDIPDFGRVEGRILSVADSSHVPAPHVHHELIPLETGNASMLGLFIQSSLNGRSVGNVSRSLDPGAYVWGTPTEAPGIQMLGPEFSNYVLERLRLFDIRHIYTDLVLEAFIDPAAIAGKRLINTRPLPQVPSAAEAQTLGRKYSARDGRLEFNLYTLRDGTAAEALPYLPRLAGADWKATTKDWFLQSRGVPVMTGAPPPPAARAARPGESARILETSPRSDRIVLQVDATDDIPVLVKTGFFPTWRAVGERGEIEIQRATPNLMVVYGHGRIAMEYHRPVEEYLGLLLCCLGFALLVFVRD